MTYYIWVEPTASGAVINTGSILPDGATSFEHASTSHYVAGMAAKIQARHGSLSFSSVEAADAALAAQATAARAGL